MITKSLIKIKDLLDFQVLIVLTLHYQTSHKKLL
jgi:hypothetical protein